MNPMQIISLIDEYNSDPRKFTDAESEVIAELAKAMNRNFKRESKPIRKAIFELGDMATFGLLPDSYRPVARGEKAFGETDLDSDFNIILEQTKGVSAKKEFSAAKARVRGRDKQLSLK